MKSLVVLAVLAGPAHAGDDDGTYLLHHPDDAAWWVSGQINSITQVQPGFHSPYAGGNSFTDGDHFATSFVATVYAAYQPTSLTSNVSTVESLPARSVMR